jgi:hypothetical protein
MFPRSFHAGRWFAWLLTLALLGTVSGVASAASGTPKAAAGGGSHGSTYIPQLGRRVPNDKVAAFEHEFVNPCYPEHCKGPQHVRTSPGPPLGPLDRIPARFVKGVSEVPISPVVLRFTNGWLVSNGRILVGVYAGAAGDDPSEGRLVVLRQNVQMGSQKISILNVPGAGALTIIKVPAGIKAETGAERGRLSFKSIHGVQGALYLRSDTIAITRH